MQIVLHGMAAGYEAEHTARLFFPGAEKTGQVPETGDCVLAVSHEKTDFVLFRKGEEMWWRSEPREEQADAEYALCRLLYQLLCEKTGQNPPWGMMTGVRPVRIIHDLRAMGATEAEIAERFLGHFACTPQNLSWRAASQTCSARCWKMLILWIAASMQAFRFVPRAAVIAVSFLGLWGIRRPAHWSNRM